MDIKNKKISIIGAELSGKAAAKLALSQEAIPFVTDSKSTAELVEAAELFEKLQIDYEFGSHPDRIYDCDFIVTSPGVPSNSAVLKKVKEKGIEIFSEIEFASWFCKAKIISITGSNGKTTTTALLNHVLNESGKKCFAAGNIGEPFSDLIYQVDKEDYISLETSSFQLDYIKYFKPNIAMILNITPDHLDRYDNSLLKYKAAKLRIFENQSIDDVLILNADDPNLSDTAKNATMQKYYFSTKQIVNNGAYYSDGNFFFIQKDLSEKVCTKDDLFIKGEHNYSNALAVLIAAKLIGISNKSVANAFSSFKGVEHRLEFVREIDGIKFINDSKATNVDSVWYALNSFDEKILLILGGKDKGNDYGHILDLVRLKVRKIYAIGDSKDIVYNFFKQYVDVEKVDTLEECVYTSKKEAKQNEVVLLSPACASFDMFNNYQHRGKVFKEAVMSLK